LRWKLGGQSLSQRYLLCTRGGHLIGLPFFLKADMYDHRKPDETGRSDLQKGVPDNRWFWIRSARQ
jgi:hypothetical protein